MKQKTKKSLQKRVTVTSTGKVMRRHQFSGGHLKRKKSKSAINNAKKPTTFFSGELRAVKRMLGM
jgi:ribosomal protein L35